MKHFGGRKALKQQQNPLIKFENNGTVNVHGTTAIVVVLILAALVACGWYFTQSLGKAASAPGSVILSR